MRTSEVIEFFKTQRAVADVLDGCTQPAVAQWKEFPPPLRQLELERVTNGVLRAEPYCDRYRVEA